MELRSTAEFAHDYTFEARYLGTRGLHLDVQQRLNQFSPVNASNELPTFFSTPTAAQVGGLTNTFAGLANLSSTLPQYAAAGFTNAITANEPMGSSVYHGLALQLNRRFSKGLLLIGSYTWSHNIDDSTADFFTTVLTPRRPQDFQNLRADRSSSALDRRHRLTLTAVEDLPFFHSRSNWFVKNLLGNWEIAPIYTYESPEYATVQSQEDSNLNGDPWGDRTFTNPSGQKGVGTDVTPIDKTGATVPYQLMDANGNAFTNPAIAAYVANDPNAQYVRALQGSLPTGGRNTLRFDRSTTSI